MIKSIVEIGNELESVLEIVCIWDTDDIVLNNTYIVSCPSNVIIVVHKAGRIEFTRGGIISDPEIKVDIEQCIAVYELLNKTEEDCA